MLPFSQATEIVHDLPPAPESLQDYALPSQPSIPLNDQTVQDMKDFLRGDLCAPDLELMAPRLWIMTTPSSKNINVLTRQRVKGREIVITEEPRLHLVWIHNRIFIKPLPRYLASHAFWNAYLDANSDKLGKDLSDIRKAALGFLRTYTYLVRHETDFKIAQQAHLIPERVEWPAFCRFAAELCRIDDVDVSERYRYGKIRLTRLNLYAPFLLGRFNFEQVHGQYGDIFARLYGPILFIFAVITTVLSSMQVALAVEQLVTVKWVPMWYVSRWFSVLSLIGSALVIGWFVMLWTYMILAEWIYTFEHKPTKRRQNVDIELRQVL